MTDRSARWPWKGDTPVHIPKPADVPDAFLLPGDPARVDMAAAVLSDFEIVGQNREFRMGMGSYHGRRFGICSTGIGGASTEIVMVELAALGVRQVIRTGGMGALAADLALGDFLIVSACLPNSGCAQPYAPGDAPVPASRRLVDALQAARRERGLPGREGKVVTADGYYRAQGRPDRRDGNADPGILDRFARDGADGVEMETEVVLAVGSALDVDAAAVLAVHAHRGSDGWLEDYEQTQRDVLRIGVGALARAASS